MEHLAQVMGAFFWRLGGPGLLLLGILDSSFLFAPLGNDLLGAAMTARSHTVAAMLYYAAMSTVGSVLGCLLVDMIFRRAGEKGLEKHLSKKRVSHVKRKVEKNAFWALTLASLAPPPFPFTPFVMAASALQFSRYRMLAITGVARMVRFTVLGILALRFGPRILTWAKNPVLQGALIGLIAVCIFGSIFSVWGWIKRSRKKEQLVPTA